MALFDYLSIFVYEVSVRKVVRMQVSHLGSRVDGDSATLDCAKLPGHFTSSS